MKYQGGGRKNCLLFHVARERSNTLEVNDRYYYKRVVAQGRWVCVNEEPPPAFWQMTVIVQMLPSDWLITGSSCPAVGVDCLHSSADFSNLLTWRWPNRGGAEISISFLVEQQEKIHKGGGRTLTKNSENAPVPRATPKPIQYVQEQKSLFYE